MLKFKYALRRLTNFKVPSSYLSHIARGARGVSEPSQAQADR